jgi:hypothetical protein
MRYSDLRELITEAIGLYSTTTGNFSPSMAAASGRPNSIRNQTLRAIEKKKNPPKGRIRPNFKGGDSSSTMNVDTQSVVSEAILKGASARRSVLLRKSKEAKKQKSKFDTEMRLAGGNPQTAALYVKPPEPSPMAPLKARKTEKHGVVVGGKKDFSASAKAVGANKENAQSILDIFHEKPHGTRITVYGKKYGKNADHAMKISKKRMMGNDVHVVHGTDRIVHLNPSGAGLQVIDARTRRILLDKGHDAEW